MGSMGSMNSRSNMTRKSWFGKDLAAAAQQAEGEEDSEESQASNAWYNTLMGAVRQTVVISEILDSRTRNLISVLAPCWSLDTVCFGSLAWSSCWCQAPQWRSQRSDSFHAWLPDSARHSGAGSPQGRKGLLRGRASCLYTAGRAFRGSRLMLRPCGPASSACCLLVPSTAKSCLLDQLCRADSRQHYLSPCPPPQIADFCGKAEVCTLAHYHEQPTTNLRCICLQLCAACSFAVHENRS